MFIFLNACKRDYDVISMLRLVRLERVGKNELPIVFNAAGNLCP